MVVNGREGEEGGGRKRIKGEREGTIGCGYDRDGGEDMMEWQNLQGFFFGLNVWLGLGALNIQ
jgi:hypothetical protein